MKAKRLISWTIAFIPLIITAIVLPMLPDKIAAHYDFAGNVTRFGSKYEMLILPIVTAGMGFFWLLMEKIVMKDKEKGYQNVKVLFWGSIIMSITFTILTIWFLYLAYTQAESINDINIDFLKILAVSLSIIWIVIGNFLPKCKQNIITGIRTKWTLASENVWYKTHRWGGRLFIAAGIISGVLCLFIPDGMVGVYLSTGVLFIITILVVIYSYYIYKREG